VDLGTEHSAGSCVPAAQRQNDLGCRWVGSSANPVLLYDGVCGLCNRLVQFTLRHDHRDTFRFASLQGRTAARILEQHGQSPADLDTFYVVTDFGQPEEHLLSRSDAALFVLRKLGGGWSALAALGRVLPKLLLDAAYNLIARNRYRVFGKFDACPLPDPSDRHKFLD
jgi:predicted DCC family thiol-disulfide oxidoreductase YuxK